MAPASVLYACAALRVRAALVVPGPETRMCVQRIVQVSESGALRLSVDGGGCSGFQYAPGLEECFRAETISTCTIRSEGLIVYMSPQ